MEVRKKLCAGCNTPQYIWKNVAGRKLCKQCSSNTGVAKLSIKPTAKSKPIPPRSQKRSKEERMYLAKRIIFLTTHNMCQAHLPECLGPSSEVHHKRGRVGADLLNEEFWLGVCRVCHQWIETNPKEAYELGFSIKRIN